MSEKTMLLEYFLLLYSVVVIVVHEACRYPDFVQSRGGERDWRGHLQADVDVDVPAMYSVSFRGRLMRVVTSNDTFQRRCMLRVGNRTYLAAQRDVIVTTDRALQHRYLCMEFLRRSDGVLQLRTSRLASRMDPHLCAEKELILDSRPLVDRRHRWQSALGSGCQLSGGYDIRLYDRRLHRGVCDALDAETRLEAACGDDDDSLIHFRFRYDFCVPTGLSMRSDQVTRCAAVWVTDDDVFTVLVADNEDRLDAWCLRRPRRTFGRPFTAFLSRQLVCDDRPVTELAADALVVNMQRSEDWGASLCEDDYEGCAWDDRAECTRTVDCARTCAVCNDSHPTDCFFSVPIHGRWQSSNGATSLNVGGSSLELTAVDDAGRARSTHYECVQWRQEDSGDLPVFADHAADERLVVTRPGNGCRPRYACVQLLYSSVPADDEHSPSVIHFHMSSSRPWPIYDRLDCSSFRAQSSVDAQFTLMLSNVTRGRQYVDCVVSSLPVAVPFVVQFQHEHQRCSAHIEPTSTPADDDDRHFRLMLDGCSGKNATFDVRCLDRVESSGVDSVFLVTEMSPVFDSSDGDSVLCWLFTDIDKFYLLSSTDCDPLTSLERLQRRAIHPVAVFVDALTITSSTPTTLATTFRLASSPSLAENNTVTDRGPSNDSVWRYYSLAPGGAASNATTTTPTSQRQRDSSVSTSNQTTRREDSAPPRQSSVVDAKHDADAVSGGHSVDARSRAAAVSSFAHATGSTVLILLSTCSLPRLPAR